MNARSLQPIDCGKCKYKCSEKLDETMRQDIFAAFWDLGDYERQRQFLCQHVIEKPTVSNQLGKSRKKDTARTYTLSINKESVRVCKPFFLATLNIGDKMVRYTLAKRVHGTYKGNDSRGKHVAWNKSSVDQIKAVKDHIE